MYDYIFCGGGISALLLLHSMQDQLEDKKVLVLDSGEFSEDAYLSYWAKEPTVFDEYRIASWQKTHISGRREIESTDPYTIGLVKKHELLDGLRQSLNKFSITWSSAKVQQIQSSKKLCRVYTDAGVEKARVVFDSCPDVYPFFPKSEESITLSGYELLVESDVEIFDESLANFYIRLPKTGVFGYLLPITKTTALLESAMFKNREDNEDRKMLLDYLAKTYPKARFQVRREQLGTIPLGTPPTLSTGPRHILIGQKRGLVKLSAGYGIMSIYKNSQNISKVLANGELPKPVRTHNNRYEIMDKYFLKMVQNNPAKADRLVRHTLQHQPIKTSFALIDESLSNPRLAWTMIKSLPFLF